MSTGQLPGVVPVEVGGIASLAVRDLLHGPHQAGQVLAVVQGTLIAEFPGAPREPRVIVISPPDAVRLPNAIITSIPASTMTANMTTAATSASTTASTPKATKAAKVVQSSAAARTRGG